MHVADGMSTTILTLGPGHSLRAASRLMAARGVGAAVVIDPEAAGPGIITERDILHAIGDGQDPDTELVATHQTAETISASPEWSLEDAATTMLNGGFRRLIVTDGAEVIGLISMRDIVRCWTEAGAIQPVRSEDQARGEGRTRTPAGRARRPVGA